MNAKYNRSNEEVSKKRYWGITIFGIWFILRGLASLFQHNRYFFLILLGIISILVGIGLLKRILIARNGIIYFSAFLLLIDIYYTYISLIQGIKIVSPSLYVNFITFIIIAYYFTRSDVIDQFKGTLYPDIFNKIDDHS